MADNCFFFGLTNKSVDGFYRIEIYCFRESCLSRHLIHVVDLRFFLYSFIAEGSPALDTLFYSTAAPEH